MGPFDLKLLVYIAVFFSLFVLFWEILAGRCWTFWNEPLSLLFPIPSSHCPSFLSLDFFFFNLLILLSGIFPCLYLLTLLLFCLFQELIFNFHKCFLLIIFLKQSFSSYLMNITFCSLMISITSFNRFVMLLPLFSFSLGFAVDIRELPQISHSYWLSTYIFNNLTVFSRGK